MDLVVPPSVARQRFGRVRRQWRQCAHFVRSFAAWVLIAPPAPVSFFWSEARKGDSVVVFVRADAAADLVAAILEVTAAALAYALLTSYGRYWSHCWVLYSELSIQAVAGLPLLKILFAGNHHSSGWMGDRSTPAPPDAEGMWVGRASVGASQRSSELHGWERMVLVVAVRRSARTKRQRSALVVVGGRGQHRRCGQGRAGRIRASMTELQAWTKLAFLQIGAEWAGK